MNVKSPLGLSGNFTRADIKRAFKEKAKALHPDTGGNEEDFRNLVEARKEAYRVLRMAQPDLTGLPATARVPIGWAADRYQKSIRTIDRWLEDERVKMPKPIIIRGRRYFIVKDLLQWESLQLDVLSGQLPKEVAGGRS